MHRVGFLPSIICANNAMNNVRHVRVRSQIAEGKIILNIENIKKLNKKLPKNQLIK